MIRERALLLVTLLAPGCHSYLVPFDERPLPAPEPVETRGGERLDVDGRGQLVLRPAAGDVAAALGAGLFEAEDGLVVTHRVRPETALRPDDRIVFAAAHLRGDGAAVRRDYERAVEREVRPDPAWIDELHERGRGAGPPSERSFDAWSPSQVAAPGEDEALAPAARGDDVPGRPLPTPAELRARPDGHPVAALADLEGYLVGLGWLELDLVVVRGGEEVVVRQELAEASEALPVRLWRPATARWHGLDVVRVADLPAARRPLLADDADYLVVRVARDAPAARAGLRPLDVVDPDALEALVDERADTEPVVRAPDGREKRLRFQPREAPTELWLPLLGSYQSDGVRTHMGGGPLELSGHYSSKWEYEPTTDSYVQTFRWSFGAWIQGAGVRRASGVDEEYGINLLDGARARYFLDWASAPEEAEARRAWGGED